MASIRFILGILFFGFSIVSLTGCGGGSSSTATLSSASVSASMPMGSTQKFAAFGTYSDGTGQVITPLSSWASSNTSVAAVNASGLVTAGATPGTVTLTATFAGVSGSMTLTVVSATLSSMIVTPAVVNPSSLPVGVGQQFVALGNYSDGTSHDITTLVTWSSSDGTKATIVSSGVATGVGVGTTTITATSGGVSGHANLTVSNAALNGITVTPANPSTPLQSTQQFAATGAFSDGSSHDLTSQVTWSSLNPSVASVSSSGLATPVAISSTTITASLGGVQGSATLTVTSASLSSVTVVPSIAVGAIQQFLAIGTYSDGSTEDITRQSTWTSNNTSVATVNNNGLVTAVGPGEIGLVATQDTNTFPSLPVNMSEGITLLVTP